MNRRVALSDFHEAMKAANVVALWELEDATNDPPEPPNIWRWGTLEPRRDVAKREGSGGEAGNAVRFSRVDVAAIGCFGRGSVPDLPNAGFRRFVPTI